jgi:hypothetical protein
MRPVEGSTGIPPLPMSNNAFEKKTSTDMSFCNATRMRFFTYLHKIDAFKHNFHIRCYNMLEWMYMMFVTEENNTLKVGLKTVSSIVFAVNDVIWNTQL